MARVSDAFPSKYLRAADLRGSQPILTIDRVEMESIAEGEPQKPVLYFQGKEKGVVLNKTNANTLQTFYGDEMDDWRGETVQVYSVKTDFQGKQVDAIRMKIPNKAELRAHEEKQKKANPMDEEVPF